MRQRARIDQNHIPKSHRVCVQCSSVYHSYNKNRKYCSHTCYVNHDRDEIVARALRGAHAPRKPVAPRIPKVFGRCRICGSDMLSRKIKTCGKACGYVLRRSNPKKEPQPNHACIECGKAFHSFNKQRLYCCYGCFLKSGGALRAGAAGAQARMRYGAKKDANHNEIESAIKAFGIPVYDLSGVGGGLPDCLVWIRQKWELIEIKNPKTGYGRRGLNRIQKAWVGKWRGGPVWIIKTVEEAIRFAKGDLDEIERVQGR